MLAVGVVVALITAPLAACTRGDSGVTARTGVLVTVPPQLPFAGGADLLVYVQHGVRSDELQLLIDSVHAEPLIDASRTVYLDEEISWAYAELLYQDDPETLALLENVLPTAIRLYVVDSVSDVRMARIASWVEEQPFVMDVLVRPCDDPDANPNFC